MGVFFHPMPIGMDTFPCQLQEQDLEVKFFLAFSLLLPFFVLVETHIDALQHHINVIAHFKDAIAGSNWNSEFDSDVSLFLVRETFESASS